MNTERLVEDFLAHGPPRPLPWSLYQELLEESRIKHRDDSQLYEVSSGDILVVGDTHGDIHTSLAVARMDWDKLVFLGDYVDRGPYQLENLAFLLALELTYPEKVYLVRGNHESPLMNRKYGFMETVASRYGHGAYKLFQRVFANMSYAAVIENTFLTVHGGIARRLKRVDEIRGLPKEDPEPVNEVAFEILWNDPDETVEYFEPNLLRGSGTYLYGRRAVEEFLEENGLKAIIRAHQPYEGGYREHFGGKVITVFSCRYYPIGGPAALRVRGQNYKVIKID